EAQRVAREVLSRVGSNKAAVSINHRITDRARFARNDVRTIENETKLQIGVDLDVDGKVAFAATTATDAAGLDEVVQTALKAAGDNRKTEMSEVRIVPPATFTDPPIYFQTTLDAGMSAFQGDLVRQAADRVEGAGFVGAGRAEVTTEFNLV